MLKVKQTDKIKISPLVLNYICSSEERQNKTIHGPFMFSKNFQDNSNVQLDFKSDYKW